MAGFVPTAMEAHYVGLRLMTPAEAVRRFHGEASGDAEQEARLRRRVEDLTAWAAKWHEGSEVFRDMPAVEREEVV